MTCTIIIPGRRQPGQHPLSLTPASTLAATSTFAARGMMAPVGGPLANLITVSAASNVKEITHASTVPFGLPSPRASTLGQWGLWGASAFGAEDCLSTATHQIPIANSVHFLGSSFTQVVLFRVLL